MIFFLCIIFLVGTAELPAKNGKLQRKSRFVHVEVAIRARSLWWVGSVIYPFFWAKGGPRNWSSWSRTIPAGPTFTRACHAEFTSRSGSTSPDLSSSSSLTRFFNPNSRHDDDVGDSTHIGSLLHSVLPRVEIIIHAFALAPLFFFLIQLREDVISTNNIVNPQLDQLASTRGTLD